MIFPPNTIATCAGIPLCLTDPVLPEAESLIEVVAHATAHLCRFTGHTRTFYSVAQHSVLVSHLVTPEHALAALLHDASEAFLGDVATPLKALLPDYRRLEVVMQERILARFGLPAQLPAAVHEADRQALCIEAQALLPAGQAAQLIAACGLSGAPTDHPLLPLPPAQARQAFLDRFSSIGGLP